MVPIHDMPIVLIGVAISLLVADGFANLTKRGIIDIRAVPNWLFYVTFFVTMVLSLCAGNFIWKRVRAHMARKG